MKPILPVDRRWPPSPRAAPRSSSRCRRARTSASPPCGRRRAARRGTYVPDQVIVQFRGGAERRRRRPRHPRGGRGARPARPLRADGYLVTLDAGFTVAEALDRLRGRPEVEYAEPNAIFRASQARRVTPNDTLLPLPVALARCSTPRGPGPSRPATAAWWWPCSTPGSPTRTSAPTARRPTSAPRSSSRASTSSTTTPMPTTTTSTAPTSPR